MALFWLQERGEKIFTVGECHMDSRPYTWNIIGSDIVLSDDEVRAYFLVMGLATPPLELEEPLDSVAMEKQVRHGAAYKESVDSFVKNAIDPSELKSFDEWKKLGRSIKKGEKALQRINGVAVFSMAQTRETKI